MRTFLITLREKHGAMVSVRFDSYEFYLNSGVLSKFVHFKQGDSIICSICYCEIFEVREITSKGEVLVKL